jgi:dihydrolipoamide dehydrogenase
MRRHRIETDVAVIGAGSAGLAARAAASRAGARTLLIESGPYGTSCARVGCMPSKLLVAAARAAQQVREAGRFGLRASLEVDGAAVLARVRRERDRFVRAVIEGVRRIPERERLDGRARFVGPTTLEVDGATRVEARGVVIATGSTPALPGPLRPLGTRVLTSDTIFELERLPGSLAVLGAGATGLELGQALHRLGTRVRIFERADALGGLRDPEVRRSAHETLAAELPIQLETRTEIAVGGGGLIVRWEARDSHGEEAFERVLAATGRRPALADLDLAASGLELDEHGRPDVDPETLQCGTLPIFLAGDATGDRPVLHEAADEGRRAGRNAASYPEVERSPRLAPLFVVFSEPQIATVGAAASEIDGAAVGEASYADQGRARVDGRNAGLVRLCARREDRVLAGADLFGPDVEHAAHWLAWAVQERCRPSNLLTLPFYHPVVEEGIRTALRDLCKQLDGNVDDDEPRECRPGS